MGEPVRALRVLVLDVVDLREVVLVLVERRDLEGAAAREEGVRPEAVERARELVPVRPLRDEIREAEPPHQTLVDLEVFLDLLLRVLERRVGGVGLEEVDLPHPQERAGHLRLVPERRHDLVHFQRQIRVAPDPEREHRVHRGLARRPEDELHVERVQTAVGDPVHVRLEALDVVGLLLELRLRDQEGKVHLPVARGIELLPPRLVDPLHHGPAVREPDVDPLDRVPLVPELRLLDDGTVPLAEILFLPHQTSRDVREGLNPLRSRGLRTCART